MSGTEITSGAPKLPTGWRFKAGIVLFAMALVPYSLLAPILFRSQPLATIASLVAAGVLFQKLVSLAAVVTFGNAGFAFLKAKLFKKLTPPVEVGPWRYRIGLAMFLLPFVQNLVETYGSHIVPHLVANRLWVDILMDFIFIASLFVLGGHFWDKLRALFFVDARAVFPNDPNTTAAAPAIS
jgi:hypothetical protein